MKTSTANWATKLPSRNTPSKMDTMAPTSVNPLARPCLRQSFHMTTLAMPSTTIAKPMSQLNAEYVATGANMQ